MTAARLAEELGDARSTWQNKLNGTRDFKLDDLLRIVIAVDSALFASLPLAGSELADFFPPAYQPHLSHRDVGRAMPTFGQAPIDWVEIGNGLARHLRSEIDADRAWLVSAKAVARDVLQSLQQTGLGSMEATVASLTDSFIALEWIPRDLALHFLVVSDALTVRPSSRDVRAALFETASRLIELSQVAALTKILVVHAAPMATRAIFDALGLRSASDATWQLLELGALHRAGVQAPDAVQDIHYRTLVRDFRAGLIWLETK